nr:hypothetical protein HmN_000338000 [Hymenolepis microstoma]
MSLGSFLQGLIIGCLLHLRNSGNIQLGMKQEIKWEFLMKSTKLTASLYLAAGVDTALAVKGHEGHEKCAYGVAYNESSITPRSCDIIEGGGTDCKNSLSWR